MKDSHVKKGLYALVAALLVALIAAVSMAVTARGTDLAYALSEPVMRPLKGVMTSLVESLERVYGYVYRYDSIMAENAELRARIAELEEDYREYNEIIQENDRFRALLGFKERHAGEDYELEPVTVISWTASNFASTFTINRGSGSGIELHDAVVTADGYLVGIVTGVGNTTATVTTLLDTTMSVGALMEGTGETGIVEGNFALFREEKLRLGYLEGAAGLIIGDTVLTSGRGGTLPGGLVVGYIERLREDPAGGGSYAIVDPAADINSVTEVYVITDFNLN